MEQRIILSDRFESDLALCISECEHDGIFVICDTSSHRFCWSEMAHFPTLRQAEVITIVDGDANKNLRQLTRVWERLQKGGANRHSLVINLGGGMVTDLGGFAAATFLRGIPFIQIPTTIISQVDSSVGGKVGIDLPSGKNQAGNFYQPKGVLIDPTLLQTLPKRFIHDGMGEVIKYGCIRDLALFELLEKLDDQSIFEHWEEIIERCCKSKADLVERDVLDMGERMILNFGHTIGHAIEGCYGFGHYTHGEGVAAGMSMLTGVTEAMGLTKAGTTARLRKVLEQYGLPTDVDASAEDLIPYISNDKKMRGNHMTLIILKEIGKGRLLPLAAEDLPKYIRKKDAQ